MPYPTNAHLPPPLRRRLPSQAQSIYRAAFNQAYAARFDDPQREVTARRIAWFAVKQTFVKVGARWIDRALIAPESFSVH